MDELFSGNIKFDSKFYPKDSAFMRAVLRRQDAKDKLTALLNDSEKELLEQYEEAATDVNGITRYDLFISTLRFGVLFGLELLGYGRRGGDDEE